METPISAHQLCKGRNLLEEMKNITIDTANSVLMLACYDGDVKVLNILNEDYNVDLFSGALWGCVFGRVEIIKYVNINSSFINNYILETAFLYGSLDIVKYLIEECHFEFNVEIEFENACKNGHLDIVKYLNENYSVNLNEGIRKAQLYGNYDIINYLINLMIY
jgi:ankyrin repeat protein